MLISSNESMDSYDIDSLELPETREELKRNVHTEINGMHIPKALNLN